MQRETSERVKDLVTAAALLVVGIGGFLFINPKGAAVTEGPGGLSWRSLPFIYSSLLIALTLVYVATSAMGLMRSLRDEPRSESAGPGLADLRFARITDCRRLATVACLVAYAATLPLFGFAIVTPLLLFALFYVFGRTSILQNVTLALAGGLGLWFLFVGILKLPLRGSLWDPLTPAMANLLRSVGL